MDWSVPLSRKFHRKFMKNLQRRWSGLARDKVLSLISLATKAGRCASGEFLTESETKSGRAGLVVVAEDASENTKKKFRDMCEFYDVPIIFYSDKDTLGHAMGKQFRASLAILDEGFAKGILKALKECS
jgi:ribosomal protein L7Ae-like RNA K-turn-binding protein